MVFAAGVQRQGCLSGKRRRQRPRKPRAQNADVARAFNGVPETPGTFKLVWETPELCRARLVLGDLRRVLLFDNTAVVLEASEQQLEHRCLACPLTHQSRNWDCADQRVEPASLCRGVDDEIAYCPLTGSAVGVIRLAGCPVRTRFRRLSQHAYHYRPEGHNRRCS